MFDEHRGEVRTSRRLILQKMSNSSTLAPRGARQAVHEIEHEPR
jgi:hypothetical protein